MSPSFSYTPRSGASSSAHKPPTSRHRDRGPLLFNGNGHSSISISAAQQQQTSSSKGSGSGGVNVQVLLRCRYINYFISIIISHCFLIFYSNRILLPTYACIY
jgi:hypothetical protein